MLKSLVRPIVRRMGGLRRNPDRLGSDFRRLVLGQRGQNLVEFALVLPVLMFIFLGTIDFARLYFSYVSVTNAARVGAAYGMDPVMTNQYLVKQAVKAEASPYVTVNDSDITVTANPSWSAGSNLTVEVRTQFSAFTPLVSSFWGGGPLTLRRAATTRFYTP